MWNLKFTVHNLDTSYALLTEKYKVVDYMYPVDYYVKGNRIFILCAHLLEGEESERKKYALALKNHKKTLNFEDNGKQIITLIREEESLYSHLFDIELFHPAPVIIKEGYEYWNISSWNRRALEKLIEEIEKWSHKFSEFHLLNLSKADLSEIYFPRILPELPEKQKRAFGIAMEEGYYTWPRKADLAHLSKKMGVSISTYQEHLRKAEAKLLPFFASSLRF